MADGLFPPDAATTAHGRRKSKIVLAIGTGAASRGATMLAGVISVPLAIHYLGGQRYGVWITISTMTGWLGILDLGIANTLINHISRAYALNDQEMAKRYVSNALAITLAVSLLTCAVCIPLIRLLDWMEVLNARSPLTSGEIAATFGVALLLFVGGLVSNLCGKVLGGYQMTYANNLLGLVGVILNLGGLLLGVRMKVGMPALLFLSSGVPMFVYLGAVTLGAYHRKRWLLPSHTVVELALSLDLLRNGSSFLLLQLAYVLAFSTDNFVVSHYLGAAQVTPYSVTWRAIAIAGILGTLAAPALWPAYAEAYAKRHFAWIRSTFFKMMGATLAINIFVTVVFLCYGQRLMQLWGGPAARPSYSLVVVMVIWSWIGTFMGVEACLLNALGRIRFQGKMAIIAAVSNFGLSIVLVQSVGAVGVVLGTIVSYCVFLIVPQSVVVVRLLAEMKSAEDEDRDVGS